MSNDEQNEQRNGEDLNGSGRDLVQGYYPSTRRQELRKITISLIQSSQFPGGGSNRAQLRTVQGFTRSK